jgi:hypothetical protein
MNGRRRDDPLDVDKDNSDLFVFGPAESVLASDKSYVRKPTGMVCTIHLRMTVFYPTYSL